MDLGRQYVWLGDRLRMGLNATRSNYLSQPRLGALIMHRFPFSKLNSCVVGCLPAPRAVPLRSSPSFSNSVYFFARDSMFVVELAYLSFSGFDQSVSWIGVTRHVMSLTVLTIGVPKRPIILGYVSHLGRRDICEAGFRDSWNSSQRKADQRQRSFNRRFVDREILNLGNNWTC